MKRTKKPVFFIVAISILVFSYLAIFGLQGQHGDLPRTHFKGIQNIRWGIDIRGGVEATFCPAEGVEATAEQMKGIEDTIKSRLISQNVTDYELFGDSKNNRIIVRFPWKSEEADFNPEAAIKEIASTGELTFREGNEYETVDPETGKAKTPKGKTAENILITGKDIKKAWAATDTGKNGELEQSVNVEFTAEGKTKFADVTKKAVGQKISIWMDDTMLSDPTVQSVITDGVTRITGNFDSKSASSLAGTIMSGALPFKLETKNFSTISPSLGSASLGAMLVAGIVAFSLICLMMLTLFRLPGFVACIALIGHLGLTFAFVSGFFHFVNSFTLTLPGIAGIILSIGMGVDANVIIASRIKEELREGKPLDKAIDAGSKNSFWAIFDGNVTVIIVALILMGIFGPANILSFLFGSSVTGSIYSFGWTLLIGVFCNFIMSMTAAQLMNKSLSEYKFLRKASFFGGPSIAANKARNNNGGAEDEII